MREIKTVVGMEIAKLMSRVLYHCDDSLFVSKELTVDNVKGMFCL